MNQFELASNLLSEMRFANVNLQAERVMPSLPEVTVFDVSFDIPSGVNLDGGSFMSLNLVSVGETVFQSRLGVSERYELVWRIHLKDGAVLLLSGSTGNVVVGESTSFTGTCHVLPSTEFSDFAAELLSEEARSTVLQVMNKDISALSEGIQAVIDGVREDRATHIKSAIKTSVLETLNT